MMGHTSLFNPLTQRKLGGHTPFDWGGRYLYKDAHTFCNNFSNGLSLVYSFFLLSEEDGYTFYPIFPYPPYPHTEERKGYICICPYIFNDLSFV